MSNNNGSQSGNGASKRMSNSKHKANRAASYTRGEIRKAGRIAANQELHKAKVLNNGLGARELRRANKAHTFDGCDTCVKYQAQVTNYDATVDLLMEIFSIPQHEDPNHPSYDPSIKGDPRIDD